jgi:hypothetical protein
MKTDFQSLNSDVPFWRFYPYGAPGANVDFPYTGQPDPKCAFCGSRYRRRRFAEGQLSVGGRGAKWPSILASSPLIVLHEDVLDVLISEKLSGFTAHPTRIVEIANKKLAALPTPRYYIIEITGGVQVDQNQFDDFDGGVCPSCFCRIHAQPGRYKWNPRTVTPILKSWDGSDFVVTTNWRTGLSYCSKHFIDLACKHRWTNFVFNAMDHDNVGVGLYDHRITGRNFFCYHDPDWADQVARRLVEKEEQKRSGLPEPKPPEPQKPTAPEPTREELLANPRFDLIEKATGVPVPAGLRYLYLDRQEMARTNFTVDLPWPDDAMDEQESFRVQDYDPLDGATLAMFDDEFKDYVSIASNGGEGQFVVNVKEPDPELHLFILDSWDLIPLGSRLSAFLAARKYPSPDG